MLSPKLSRAFEPERLPKRASLALIGDLIHRQQVAITLIYVVEVQQSMPLDAELPAEIDRGEVILGRAEELAKARGLPEVDRLVTDLLQARSAGAAIVDEAIERDADAIVMAATIRRSTARRRSARRSATCSRTPRAKSSSSALAQAD